MSNINRKILENLVCPVTKTGLRYNPEKQELISDRAKLAYPIQEGIPVMIAERARPLND
jgi:uncharacterized protein YbaR (Trm112 family)